MMRAIRSLLRALRMLNHWRVDDRTVSKAWRLENRIASYKNQFDGPRWKWPIVKD